MFKQLLIAGSALITNFAQSKAHDLFYYEEPKDMMEGEIATPGCYLEAKDIDDKDLDGVKKTGNKMYLFTHYQIIKLLN